MLAGRLGAWWDARMGEFDFLVGVYDVRNRRKAVRSLAADLELTEKADWEEFPAVNTGSRYLNGQVVVDQYEGVFPDGRVVTLVDVHAYDPGTDEWSNTIHAGGSAPDWEPYRGRFTDGAGEFFQLIETPDGEPLHVRHTWDRITDDSARFQQAFSRDGTAWSTNWVMELTRRG
jgi:hypothetical protein